MILECANPACHADFDYHEGQFFRFRKPPGEDGRPANPHSVQHFWLCGRCAIRYRLQSEPARGILLRSRSCEMLPQEPVLIGAA